MKELESITFEWLSTTYRFTKHNSANITEIEKYVKRKYRKGYWVTIYFGHIDPLQEAIKFFEATK